MSKRGFSPTIDSRLAQIYCAESRGLTLKSDGLLQKFAVQFPNRKYDGMGVACEGAASNRCFDRLRVLLRKSVEMVKLARRHGDQPAPKYDLCLSLHSIFRIVWLLAEKSADGAGRECMTLVQQVSGKPVEYVIDFLKPESEVRIGFGFLIRVLVILRHFQF